MKNKRRINRCVFVHLNATVLALLSALTLTKLMVGVGGPFIPAVMPVGVGDFAPPGTPEPEGHGGFVFERVLPVPA